VSKHVLVVDDEPRIREVVSYALEKDGYRVTLADSGRAALEALGGGAVDLVVLDVMLPDMGGLEVCRRIRERGSTPVLFLSARGEEIDRVVGLEIGGDDYLTQPFSPRELVARVRAVFRRVSAPAEPHEGSRDAFLRGGALGAAPLPALRQGERKIEAPAHARYSSTPLEPAAPPRTAQLRHGPTSVDLDRHEAHHEAHVVALTPTELGVLVALLERPGVVLSRGQLMQRAYRYDNHVTERTIDTHVRRIRAKFRAVGGDPIATVHGVGYKAADLDR
jgi:two-component system OmpR family response regulator